MNHIYKVIWSRVKNSYVVVSEIAGTARKVGVRVSKKALAAVLAAFIDRDFCKPCICGA